MGEEFSLTNLEAELSARERTIHAKERSLDERRRLLAQREASLRERATDLVSKAKELGVTVHTEVQAAVTSRVLEQPLAEVAASGRRDASVARERAADRRRAALDSAEQALRNIEEVLGEADGILGQRETSLSALAREVIRQEREHLMRREARAREIAEAARQREQNNRQHGQRPHMPPIPRVTRPAPSDAGSDRRVHPRVMVELDVTMSSEHNFFTGFTRNVSEGGLFIATHEYLSVGEALYVAFRLPSGHEVRTQAQVQWLREYNPSSNVTPGMGVKFLSLTEADIHAIMDFLRHREPLFFE